jgi:hypothetical protein
MTSGEGRVGDGGTGPPDGPAPPPPGAQAERTRLAWRRTVLTATVVGLLAARVAGAQRAWPALAAVALGWLALVLAGHRRIAATALPRPAPPGRTLLAPAAAVLGYAVLGLLTVGGCGGAEP